MIGAPLALPPAKGVRCAREFPWKVWARTMAFSLHSNGIFSNACRLQLLLPLPAGDLRSEAGRAHVDACHALYCAALQKLYDEHKERYAPNRKQDLRFVE